LTERVRACYTGVPFPRGTAGNLPRKSRIGGTSFQGGFVAGPSDGGERRTGDEDDERGLSDVASGYRKAAPYMAASTSLVAAVAVFTLGGYWLDGKLGNKVPWLTMLGAAIGMTGGFISFFRTVLGTSKKNRK
jgi:ATP synthase protein I